MPFDTITIAQAAVTAAGLALAALPPADGPMLVIPLDGDGRRAMIAALEAGARPIDGGWLPGSVVVRGERRRLAPALLREGALVVASPTTGCSPARRGAQGRGQA